MRNDMSEVYGEEFMDEFDAEFEIEQVYVPTRLERMRSFMLGLIRSGKFMYVVGFIDGLITIAAIQYFLR